VPEKRHHMTSITSDVTEVKDAKSQKDSLTRDPKYLRKGIRLNKCTTDKRPASCNPQRQKIVLLTE
jgi:hypothetical protein